MKTKASHNKFIRIIITPFRALCKARDFYVRRMMDCANGNIVGLQGTSQAPGLPRSFSVSSARSSGSDEDYRELVRAASARKIGSRIELDAYAEREMRMRAGPRAMPARSISVAMGRIDEDRPCCYFGEDFNIINGNYNNINKNAVNVKRELKYPRSKSHAVTRTSF